MIPERAVPEAPCTVTVCRGCCCGTTGKHPRTDHAGQLATLRRELGSTARVRAVDCLDVCDQSNVVVVQPSASGRRAGGRSAWLGWVLDDDAIGEVIDWVQAGGPGIIAPPVALEIAEFRPARRKREALAGGD